MSPSLCGMSFTLTCSALAAVSHNAALPMLSGGAAEAGRGRGRHALICRHCGGRNELKDTGGELQSIGDPHRAWRLSASYSRDKDLSVMHRLPLQDIRTQLQAALNFLIIMLALQAAVCVYELRCQWLSKPS